jgi:uncharacterized integral membrane protein
MFRIIFSAILLIVLAVLVVLNLDATTSVNLFGRQFESVSIVAVGLVSFVAGVVYSFIIYVGNYIARSRRSKLSQREKTVKEKEKAEKKQKKGQKALPSGGTSPEAPSAAADGPGAAGGGPAGGGAAGGGAAGGGAAGGGSTAGHEAAGGSKSGGLLGRFKRKKSSSGKSAGG